MYPFVAFVWSPPSTRASRAAAALRRALKHAPPEWTPIFESDGLTVLSRAPHSADLRLYRLQGRSGVILGRLFPADIGAYAKGWEPSITESDVARYLRTSGQQLTEDYWGAYVAFLTASAEIHHVVVRDPSGKLPCYRLRHEEVDILFADVADLTPLPLPPLTPNLQYLAASIRHSSLEIRETAIEEVTEILAGEGFERRGPSTRQYFAWDPRSIVERSRESNFEDAAGRLRRTAQDCTDAWASIHSRVVHRLSGGLDSSVVLGCLSRAPSSPSFVCLNHYVEDHEGDERHHAEVSCARAGCHLIERPIDLTTFVFGEPLLAMPPSAKPRFSQCLRLMLLRLINPETERFGADAVWTGQGGDHLFLKATGIPTTADFVADHGWRAGLVRIVRDEAHRCGQPYASLLLFARQSARAQGRRSPALTLDANRHFVEPGALPKDVDRYATHPWTLAAEGLPPGRQRQIALLADVVNRHRPLAGVEQVREHHPLLSQPIVEQCLRTPTYLHLQGGRHRSLARYAFRDCVPRPILEREDKGATTELTVECVRRSAPFLCDLVLDGILARERIVARGELEACLRDGQVLREGQLSPLLACVAAEVWIRTWRGGGRAAPPRRSE